jgi:mannose-1-phosphate guanylyltransferase
MIVAAGLGTRLRPLSDWLPKPALPIRGVPVIAHTLAWLARHGVTEVIINVHHLADCLEQTARRHCPAGLSLRFSREPELLDTGGGIRKVAGFLRESDPCLVVGGDMLCDTDLTALVRQHREGRDAFTAVLRGDDPRASTFGTIGIDADARIRRIGDRFDLGAETAAGVYTWVNTIAARAFDTLPDRDVFSHLDDWLAPLLRIGAHDIRARVAAPEKCVWEPVGTVEEYLAVNLDPPRLSYWDFAARSQAAGVRVLGNVVLGAGASIAPDASLQRAVVWEGESVPDGLRAHDGVFAHGAFHPCRADGSER